MARTLDIPNTSDRALKRSANMARIRGKHTAPEMALRKALWRIGLRYRLHAKVEGTRPDIVFTSRRLAVFIDGCFWHGCPLHYVRPRARPEFWADKLKANTTRDRSQTLRLLEHGWSVLRFWEHEVETRLDGVVSEVVAAYYVAHPTFKSRSMVVRVESIEVGAERWYIEDLLNPTAQSSEIQLRLRKARR